MDSPIASVKDRLNLALSTKRVTAAELSRRTGISKGSISQYKNGVVNPKQDRIYLIANALGISEAWLMGYDVPMSKSEAASNPQSSESALPNGVIPAPDVSGMKKIPVLGSSACGTPIEAVRSYNYVEVDSALRADFALIAEGKSMTGAGILDGSMVFFQETPNVDNGQIAAVTVDNATTIKRFYKYPGLVILKACNPDFEDQEYTGDELENIHIFGKAVACLTGL